MNVSWSYFCLTLFGRMHVNIPTCEGIDKIAYSVNERDFLSPKRKFKTA